MDFNKLKDFMNHLTSWRMPGNSITVYLKDEPVFKYSTGFSDMENKVKMTGDELINIYSCSKLTTVVAALQLYEKGEFLLDDPLYNYIEEYKEMYIKDSDGNIKKAETPITMRQLFTHTSGLSYNWQSEHIKEVTEKTNGKSPTIEVARAFAKEPLVAEPGEIWNYSMSHDILAAVVEIVTGKRFSEYVKENIFAPIGVDEVYYHPTEEIYSKMAQQYRYIDGDINDDPVAMQVSPNDKGGYVINIGKKNIMSIGSEYDSGGAGIIISVPSYAKFANTLAMGGKSKTGERILSKGTIDLIQTNQLNSMQLKGLLQWTTINKGCGFGLGAKMILDKATAGFTGNKNEFSLGGAAGATVLVDTDSQLSYFYAHHMINPQEPYYHPRLRNVVYSCLD